MTHKDKSEPRHPSRDRKGAETYRALSVAARILKPFVAAIVATTNAQPMHTEDWYYNV